VSTDAPRIRVMDRAEVDLAIEWAAREGWNPGLEDAAAFHAADPEGFLISEDADGTPVASMSAVRHGDGLGFVGFYIVAPERRGQGHGIAIWRAGLARLAGHPLFLTSPARTRTRPRSRARPASSPCSRRPACTPARRPRSPSTASTA